MTSNTSRINWSRWLLALYVAAIVLVVVQRVLGRPENNFAIFRAAFGNLVSGRDLYAAHLDQYRDLYKYSPTFAVLFAPFALLPVPLALFGWCALNTLLLYVAVRRLRPGAAGTLALALMAFEVIGNMQRAQSNSLVAALVVLAFLALERGEQLGAATAIGIGAFVKIFPLAALPMALCRPRRLRFALIFAVVMIVLAALPLLVTSPHALAAQYQSWYHREMLDAQATAGGGGGGLYGGIMTQFRLVFGPTLPNWPIQLAGTVVLLLPLAVRWRDRDDPELRRRFLSSLLVYMVIFNPQAESPSFVIAITGIAIWYVSSARTAWQTALMALTFVVVSLSSSSLVPAAVLHRLIVPYHLKTVPCFLVWLVMQTELLAPRFRASRERADVRELDTAGARYS